MVIIHVRLNCRAAVRGMRFKKRLLSYEISWAEAEGWGAYMGRWIRFENFSTVRVHTVSCSCNIKEGLALKCAGESVTTHAQLHNQPVRRSFALGSTCTASQSARQALPSKTLEANRAQLNCHGPPKDRLKHKSTPQQFASFRTELRPRMS